jgi:hypothetical protein
MKLKLVLDDDLNVAHRRTEIGRQGAQRVVVGLSRYRTFSGQLVSSRFVVRQS